MIKLQQSSGQSAIWGLVLMGMFVFAPVVVWAQGASSSPAPPKITGPALSSNQQAKAQAKAKAEAERKTTNAPPKITGPTLTPVQQAKAEAERKMTNAPPRPPPGAELIGPHLNGEIVKPLENFWDGVDDQGNLHTFVASDPVLNDVGAFVNTVFPAFVNVADMNDDKLPDLVVGDRWGYLWIYFNSGKKGKPQFTTNTIIPTFLGVASRINVADWDGDMDNDVILGTYYGNFQILPNIGTTKQPKFTRDMGIPRFCDEPSFGLQTLTLDKKPFVLGMYMVPWVMDWNKDGKQDLIFGEGTYSANSVRVAFNSGSLGKPTFIEDGIFFLAYGGGYEQLVPSIVDYNGDGIPDVMCGTRTGEIRLYKGTGRTVSAAQTFRGIKAPAALDFDRNLPIDNLEVLETMTAPFPYDWNDDGLFDIVMGSTSGRILVALNEGTKTEPLFKHAEAIQGVNADPDLVQPSDWYGTVGRDYHCNSAGYLSAEQAIVLKTGKPPVKLPEGVKPAWNAPVEDVIKPVEGQYFLFYRYMKNYPGWTAYPVWTGPPGWEHFYRGGKTIGTWTPGARSLGTGKVGAMAIGKNYVISFSYILTGRDTVVWRLTSGEVFTKYNEEFDDYDTSVTRRDVDGTPLMPTLKGWQKMTMQFTCPGEQRGQALVFPMIATPGVGVAQEMTFSIGFWLPPSDCQLLLDNFSLKEVGGMP